MNPIDEFKKVWNSLNSEQRTIAGVIAAVDTAAKGYALWDLSRTDSSKLRGPKWLWTPVIGAVNTIGWLAYFVVGKKR